MGKTGKVKGKVEAVPQHILLQLDKYGHVPPAAVEGVEDWETAYHSTGVTPSVLEQVLIALIRGHKLGRSSEQGEQSRLRAAMKAVTGQGQYWSPWLDQDRKYIEQMISIAEREGNLRELLETGNRGKSRKQSISIVTHLATRAVRQIENLKNSALSDPQLGHVKKIAEKFTGTYFRKQKALKSPKAKRRHHLAVDYPRVWFHIARRHDFVEESLELQTVERILGEFGKFDIAYKFERPWE